MNYRKLTKDEQKEYWVMFNEIWQKRLVSVEDFCNNFDIYESIDSKLGFYLKPVHLK